MPDARAQPQPSGGELYRFLDDAGALVSVRNDGTVWLQTIDNRRWRLVRTKAPEVGLERWAASKLRQRRLMAETAPWRLEVDELPSQEDLDEWADRSQCPTVDGEADVELDGRGPNGCPSWFVALGYV